MNQEQGMASLELQQYDRMVDEQTEMLHQRSWIDELLAEEVRQPESSDTGDITDAQAPSYTPEDAMHNLNMPMGIEEYAEAMDQGVVRLHSADDINFALRHPMEDIGQANAIGTDDSDAEGLPNLHTNSLPQIVGVQVAAAAINKASGVRAMESMARRKRGAKGEARRTLANMRKWLKVDSKGVVSMVQMDKYRIINKLGVQWRDLRIIDPNLATSYPSAILCRDQALVLNLEFIKAIVTTTYILILNPEDKKVLPFVEQLKHRIAATQLQLQPSSGLEDGSERNSFMGNGAPNGQAPDGGAPVPPRPSWANGRHDLPFELKVLELCLEQVLTYLDASVRDLDTRMRSALDKLTDKISAATLESVRKLKGVQKSLTTKVETIRGLLEQLLDDQEDMHKINLSAMERIDAEEAEQAQREASLRRVSLDRTSLKALATSAALAGTDLPPDTPTIVYKDKDGFMDSSSSSSGDSWSSEEEEEVQMVEQLLELYFMQLDNLLNRLQALNEYVDDTEDLINIQLDEHRNQIISINLLITMATVLLSAITAVSGIFGMNLNSKLENSYITFILVCAVSAALAVVLWLAFCALLWRNKLLNLGSKR